MSAESLKTPVLIVGAGPTGLAAAAFLARLGVAVRIIDRSLARSDKSKALGVQAGTLECIAHALGEAVAQRMVAAGRPAHAAWLHFDDRAPVGVDLRSIPSRFDFILILAQSETERLLEEELARLGVRVERGCELVEIGERDGEVRGRLRSSGQEQAFAADYVIGADGAHSAVREGLGIPFGGASYPGSFILGDVQLRWPWEYGVVRTMFTESGVVACFPLAGERRYRIIMIPRAGDESASTSAEISFAEFGTELSRLTGGRLGPATVELADPVWLTRFRLHHRMVREFQRGRVFLAGDAAHIHSPVGGQGMNTGIQDVFNLASKLARVIRGGVVPDLLAEYARERRPVARRVLWSTDFVFRAALRRDNPLWSGLRRGLLPRIAASAIVQRRVFRAISEVDVARREIARFGPSPGP